MADAALSKSGIYAIRNTVSGRVYVGSAVHLWSRWRHHRNQLRRGVHHAAILQRSWDKHGESAFTFEVLEPVEDKGALLIREQHWIDTLGAAKSITGMNSRPMASNNLGLKRSPESCAKMAATMIGRPKSTEHRANVAAGVRAYFAANPDARERQRLDAIRTTASKKGVPLTPETLAKISERCKASWAANKAARLAGKRPDNRSLTYLQAEEIRALKADGWTYDRLVERTGLDRATLHQIVHRKTYARP